MKVALVYDRVNKWGGAERVLLALREIFPGAPLYTSVYNPKTASWAKVFPKIYTSFLQKFPFARTKHELYALLMPLAFESFNFDDYDLVISVTSEAAKGIITKPTTKHICYCLTPTRYLWSGYDTYFKGMQKFISKPITNYLQWWDKVAAQRPDTIVSISTEVQKRIKKYYNRDSIRIFPPVELVNTTKKKNKEDYFLIVSRLVSYKKVDLAIETFNELNYPLVIVGSGRELAKLKKLAKPNVTFLGEVDDRTLSAYYQGCKAVIFPQEEDFGIVAVEAQLFGKPIIAYKKGGAADTVIDNVTGVLFSKQTKESLEGAINTFHKLNFNATLIARNAQKFSKDLFKRKFLEIAKNG